MLQELFYLLVFCMVIAFCVRLWQVFSSKEKNENMVGKQTFEIHYSKKPLMTMSEISFYHKLMEIEKLGNYKVVPQVNLASIIHKDSEYKFRSELFRNIDFGIFNEQFEILLLIELNDSSHNTKERKKRDKKVQKICKDSNIKLIRFYTSYPNEKDYVIKRVLTELKTQND